MSNISDIKENDRISEQTAFVVMDYVSKHPKDERVINQFLLFVTYDIIHRMGSYIYGSQNAVYLFEFFDVGNN